MTDNVPSPLGRCRLIEYERSDEEYRTFASCPNCEEVVLPR
jgi:hypothetical protein